MITRLTLLSCCYHQSGVSLLERCVLNHDAQLRNQNEILDDMKNHIKTQDQATNALIQGLQRGQTELLHTQRQQGNQINNNTTRINNNTTRINDVDARVDEVRNDVSAIKTYLLERLNKVDPVAEAGPDLNLTQDEEVAPLLVLPSPGDDGIATKENSVLFRKRVVIKGMFPKVCPIFQVRRSIAKCL